MAGPRIWFAGDPHGEFRHVVRLALRHRPDAVIFLGDLELSAPLSTVMKPTPPIVRLEKRYWYWT